MITIPQKFILAIAALFLALAVAGHLFGAPSYGDILLGSGWTCFCLWFFWRAA